MTTHLTAPTDPRPRRSVGAVTRATTRERRLPGAVAVAAAVVALLLLAPLLVAAATDGGGERWAVAALTVAAGAAAVVLPHVGVPGHWWGVGAALAALGGAGLVSAGWGDPWPNVWLVLAITVGGLAGRTGPGAPLALAGVGLVCVAASLTVTGEAWAVVLTIGLSGGSTAVLVVLLATVEELRCTREELAHAAVAEERERLARDLHDLLGHTLSLVVVKAEAVRRLVEVRPDAAAAHARDLEDIGRRALLEVRESVHGTHRTTLAGELGRARTTLAAAGIEAALPTALPDLPEVADTALAWVVRESVTNVVRHAAAREVAVLVTADDDLARVEVEDDGAGPVDGGDPEGSGLQGLRTRLARVGGTLATAAGPTGFRLVAEVPLSVRPLRSARR